MAGTITFTGITSGLDTDSIVTQLMTIEARPQTLLKQQQTIVNARTKALQDINGKLTSLKSAADALRDLTLYNGTPYAGSSDSARVTAIASATAAPGTYSVGVTQLARANIKP